MAHVLGVDIGGTGIKAAPVDLDTGTLVSERVKLDTPQPAEPEAVAGVVSELVTRFSWTGPAGITFPGVVADGIVRTAAHVDKSWIGTDANKLFATATRPTVSVINHPHPAGPAAMAVGAAA